MTWGLTAVQCASLLLCQGLQASLTWIFVETWPGPQALQLDETDILPAREVQQLSSCFSLYALLGGNLRGQPWYAQPAEPSTNSGLVKQKRLPQDYRDSLMGEWV